MFNTFPLLFLLAVVGSVVVPLLLAARFRRRQWKAVYRATMVAKLGGLAWGIGLCCFFFDKGLYQPFAAASPVFVGLGLIGGLVVAEAIYWGAREQAHVAVLETRTALRFFSKGWVAAMIAVTLTFATVSGIGFALSREDGRSVSAPDGMGWSSPFPGAYYQTAALIAVAAMTLLAVIGARMLINRPRRHSSAQAIAFDDALRRETAQLIAVTWSASLALSGAGLALFEATTMYTVGRFFWLPLGLSAALGVYALVALIATARART